MIDFWVGFVVGGFCLPLCVVLLLMATVGRRDRGTRASGDRSYVLSSGPRREVARHRQVLGQ